jgi:AcrR family transcriptional regulator
MSPTRTATSLAIARGSVPRTAKRLSTSAVDTRRFRVTVDHVNITERGYVKVARARAEAQTRTALLDAADEAFLSGPWDRVALESIARSAGVSKQTLLRHFGSKDGLLEAVLRRGFAGVEEQRLGAPTHDIAGAVDNLLDHYELRGGRAMRSSNLDLAGPLADLGRRARQFHYDWVEHAFGGWLDGAHAAERRRLRAALIALCDVQAWWILSNDLGLSRAEVRAILIMAITRLLGEAR